MEKSWLFNNVGLFATQQILLPIMSTKMSLIRLQRKTDVLIPVISICLICNLGHHEKDTLQECKVISYHTLL